MARCSGGAGYTGCSPLQIYDNLSVSLRRIWTKLGGNSSYEPAGASYTVQASQKQPEIRKNQRFRNYILKNKSLYIHLHAQTSIVVALIVVNF